MLDFREDFILENLSVATAEEVIYALAKPLHQAGLVSAEYGAQTWVREQEHPTGLPTRPFCIAFPHADATGVYQSALAVARMAKPVIFQNMADPEESLEVHLVIMLANRSPEEQIQTLRNLAMLFGEPKKLVELRNQPTPEQAYQWLKRELQLG